MEDYFDIEAEIHIRASKFCTSISKFLGYRSNPLSKITSILKLKFIYGGISKFCTSESKIFDIEVFIDSFGTGSCGAE
jgi:hypothetical protein